MVPAEAKGHKMEILPITHPHAAGAVYLAHAAPHVTRATITHELNAQGIPRALFVLACVLRAAAVKGL